jgi:Uma2 family endonuclease
MSALRNYPTVTVDEYIGLEMRSEFRHEYDCGYMYAMSGASDDHMIITSNIDTLLNTQLDDTNCQPFTESMRVALPGQNYYYPDVVVTCGEREYELQREGKNLLNPIVLVEVLSPNTENYDKARKLEVYQQIPSLRDVLLVRQERVFITHYTRQNGDWTSKEYDQLTDEISLASIACKLLLFRVYKKVTWG